jgi:DNA-binding IclR family transcriptional regulator
VSLLKAFVEAGSEVGLTALSRRLGLNKTTAYRLLSALEGEGMVERGPGGEGYRLGPALVDLGTRALGADGLRAAARPALQALALATRETATLEVLREREVLILDEVVGSHVIGTLPSVGTRWPAHATSTGKVLLAHLEEPGLGAVLARPLARLTDRTITAPRALRRELSAVRARGWAATREELEPGFVAVAAPVRGIDGRVLGAISVGGPRGRLKPALLAEIAGRLPAAASGISARLGYRGPNGVGAGLGKERSWKREL